MKTFLIATALICSLIYVRAQTINNPSLKYHTVLSDAIYIDTTPPKYQYFLKASIDINQWQRATDTIVEVMGNYGRHYYPEEAEVYRALLYKQIGKISFTLDSVLIPKAKKP